MSSERVLKYCFFFVFFVFFLFFRGLGIWGVFRKSSEILFFFVFFVFFGFFRGLGIWGDSRRVLKYCFFVFFVFFEVLAFGGDSRKSSVFFPEGLSQDLQNIIFFISLLVFCRVFEDCYFFVLSVLPMAFSQDPKFVFYLLHTRVWCLARKNNLYFSSTFLVKSPLFSSLFY